MVTTTTPGGQCVSICTCTWTGRHLATFTRRPGLSLYTLATNPPQVAASAQVSASGQVAASCSCGLLTHQTLLWHHRLGHPSLQRLRGMHSRLLGRERYFRLVLDDYTRYTTVFPLRSKGQVVDVLIPWIRAVYLQLRKRFHQDLPVLGLHSDRGVMEVTCTSMIHAAAPHFLWPFAVRFAAHQLNLWPHVSLPKTSPTLRWTGEVGDASVFRVWGSRAFVRDMSADKLFARAIPCLFLGFVPDAPGWQFYHPTSRCVFLSQDVMFDESVPFYHLFPYRSAPPPPPPLFLAPGPPPVDPHPPQGPAPSGVSHVDPLRGPAPNEVAVGSGAARGAASGGAVSGGEEPGGEESEGARSGGADLEVEEPGGAKLEGVEPGGAESKGAVSGGVEPRGAASSGGPSCASKGLSPQQLHEWLVRRACLRRGATRAGGVGDAGAGGTGVTAGDGGTGGAAAAGPGGARTRDPTKPGATVAGGSSSGGARAGGAGAGGGGVGGAGVGGTGAGGAGAGGAGAVDPGGPMRRRPYFVPLLQQVLGVPSFTSLTPPLLSPPPDQSQPPLLSASPLPAPSPCTEQSDGLTERREPASRPVSCVCTARRVPRSRPPPIPGTHNMALCPSSVPLRVPLPDLPESSFPEVPDPESDCAHAASPTVSLLLATADTDPSFESAATSALVAELLDFAAARRLDYATALVAESESASPPSVRAPCEWHATLKTTLAALRFAPSTADLSLFLRTDTSLLPFYVLGYIDDLVFPIADTEALTLGKSELQKRHTCTDLGELRNYLCLPITRDRARCTITLTQSHMVHQVLQRFAFQFSSPQPTPLSTRHSLSTPPSDESVEPSGPYPELVGCLMYLMTCTRPDLAYRLSLLAHYVAPSRHRKVHWDAAKRVLRYLCSTSGMGLMLGGRGPVVLTGHADASWDEAMLEAERPSQLLAQVNYVALVKQGDNKEASCSLVGVVELTVSLAPEAGEDFQAMVAAVQENPAVVLLDSGCSHHLMGTKEVFVDLQSSSDIKHVRDFNGALQDVQGRGTVDLQGEAGRANEPAFGRSVVALRTIISVTKSTPDRLHARLAHVGMNTIRSSAKHEVATGLDLNSASGADLPSVSCVGGKLARHTFPDQGSDADDVLAVVHVDLCRPFWVVAKDGSLYFLLLKDRKTRYVWVRPVAKKSDALQEFVQWLAVTERQMKKSVLIMHSDQRGEFLGKQFTFLVSEQQRGGKLKPKARWGLHLGVSEESKGWELLDIADNRVVTTSDVVFYENMSLEVGEPAAEDVEDVPSPSPSPALRAPPLVADLRWLTLVSASGDEGRSGALRVAPAKSIAGGRHDVQQVDVRVKSTPPGEEQAEEVHPTVVKSAKGAGEQAAAKPTKMQSATRQSAEEPTTGEKLAGKPAEVQQDDEGSEAGDDGGDAEDSTDSDVVEVQRGPRQSGRIQRPPDFYVPAAFTTVYDEVNDDLQYDDIEKYHIDNTVEREKARLVVKGFTQVYGANYDETYASLSSYITQRIFLSIVAVLDLNLMQLDMKNAFLQSKLDRVLYMYQSDYFDDGTGQKKSQVDTALNFKVGDDKVTGWVLVYVDDLFAPSSSAAMLKELLKAAFELWEILSVQKYLGLEIVRDMSVRKLWLHQQGYADKLRWRFLDEEQNGCTLKTPVSVDAYATLTFDDEEAQVCEEEEYRQKVGSLQLAATTTRPDIAFACSKLGSGLTMRSDQQWLEVDRCLAYLANTRDTALEFGGGAESLKLVGYVDADDAGDKQNRTSTGGYVFVFGGAAISWLSQRIKCATLSSTESEYVAATEASNEGRRLRFLLAQFRQLDVGTPTVPRVDNKSAITVADGMGLTGNLKHMER
ncbi:unnamed protein product [Closterium sp. NIES-54]